VPRPASTSSAPTIALKNGTPGEFTANSRSIEYLKSAAVIFRGSGALKRASARTLNA
jgi:hypothetical protein